MSLFERFRGKEKNEPLPIWAMHIQDSYKALQWEMEKLSKSPPEQDPKYQSSLVRQRLLNLRQTIQGESYIIPMGIMAGSVDRHTLIFDNSLCALVKVPDQYVIPIMDSVLFDKSMALSLDLQDYCDKPDVIQKITKGFLSNLPRGVRKRILQQ